VSIKLSTKRIYEPYSKDDGFRILIDRLWPRGISKEKAHIDLWFKEITPSTDLRKWYNHEEEKFEEFRNRYNTELDGSKELIVEFLKGIKNKNITLLFAGKDSLINHAVVLKEYMNTIIKRLKL
jgi:uncharacterized protein YeaO (DUF488 family)